MACGPNLAPGRCEVPPSNGAPMIMMSVPAQDAGSARSAPGHAEERRIRPVQVAYSRHSHPSRCTDLNGAWRPRAGQTGTRTTQAGRADNLLLHARRGSDGWARFPMG